MTHYELLGVSATSPTGEIRRAYLAKAREAHPDVVGDAGESRMRELNAAWSILSNPSSRELYDLSLPSGPRGKPTTIRPREPSTFVPYDAADVDDDDEWRYADDETDPATAPGAMMQLAPMVMVAVGIVGVITGGMVGLPPVMALGGIFVLLGAIAFLIVPLMVMARSATVEQARDRNRGNETRR